MVLLLCVAAIGVVVRRRSNNTQQQQQDAQLAELGGNEVMEMVDNPLRAYSTAAATAAAAATTAAAAAPAVDVVQRVGAAATSPRRPMRAVAYEAPLAPPVPAGGVYYSEIADPPDTATYATPIEGAVEYAAAYAALNQGGAVYAASGDGGSASIYTNDAYGNVPGSTSTKASSSSA